MDREPLKSNCAYWKFNSSLAQLARSVPDPPKTQVKAGNAVEENSTQYREAKEANVMA